MPEFLYDKRISAGSMDQETEEKLRLWQAQNKDAIDLLNTNTMRAETLARSVADAIAAHFSGKYIPEQIECEYLTALMTLGGVGYRLSRYTDVFTYTAPAVDRATQIGFMQGVARGCNTLGSVYLVRGEYKKAADYFLRSLELHEQSSDRRGAATAYMNVGNVHYEVGNLSNALDYFSRSLELREQTDDVSGQGASLTTIGMVHFSARRYDEALEYFLRSLKKREESENRQGLAITYLKIADTYLALHDGLRAMDYASRSYRSAELTGNILSQAGALVSTGKSQHFMGMHEDAMDSFRKALPLQQSIQHKRGEVETLLSMAEVYMDLGRVQDAHIILEHAKTLASGIGLRRHSCSIEHLIARAYEMEQDHLQALEHFKAYHFLWDEIEQEEREKREQNMSALHQVEQARKEAEIYRLRNTELQAANSKILRQQELLEDQASKILQVNSQLMEQNLNLEELNKEKNELLGILAHDLKNPLTGIIIYASTVRRFKNILDHIQIDELMDKIESTASRMHETVVKMLDINKMEENRFQLEISDFSLLEIAEDVVARALDQARIKNISIDLSCSGDYFGIVSDKEKCSAILENLISNAIKYSEHGQKVMVRLTEMAEQERYLMEVIDNGPGIQASDMPRLFKRYSRLSAKPTGGENSTGLGLSIVKKLSELLRGNVECSSEGLGKGSTFRVELPRYLVNAD
jgi:signal transduction histidine kinase